MVSGIGDRSKPVLRESVQRVVQLFQQQAEYFRATEPEVLYAGAVGAGKTVCLVLKCVARAMVPGACELIVRKTNKSLEESTLKTLLYGDGEFPPILPVGSYTINWSKHVIKIHGGGEIRWCGLDDPAKMGSRNFSGIHFDECTDIDDEFWWNLLIMRCRAEIPNLPLQVNGACNPGPPTHYLANRFGINALAVPREGTKLIRTRSTDNIHLPAAYVARINMFTGNMRRKYVLGEWVAVDGLVYGCWDRDKHLVPACDFGKGWKKAVIGYDRGYTDPFAAILLLVDGEGRVSVAAERYGSGVPLAQRLSHVQELAAIARGLGVPLEVVRCDPSANEDIDAFVAAGLPAVGIPSSIEDGIEAVRSRMEQGLLAIDPACKNTTFEVEAYTYEPNGKPKDKHNHAMDAVRYGVRAIKGTDTVGGFGELRVERIPKAPHHRASITIDGDAAEVDIAIRRRMRAAVVVQRRVEGPLWIWREPMAERRYLIGVAGGIEPKASHAVVLDADDRRVVAELQVAGGIDGVVPIAGLILHYNAKAVCVMASNEAGRLMAQELAERGLPVLGGVKGWVLNDKALNDALVAVRTAWDTDLLYDPSEQARAHAWWYRWTSSRFEPSLVTERPELRRVWADWVMARAGLLRLLDTTPGPVGKLGKDPLSGETIPYARAKELERIVKASIKKGPKRR